MSILEGSNIGGLEGFVSPGAKDAAERGATVSKRAGVAVIVNPRSRANRRNPRIAADFHALVGDAGRVLAPKSLDELEETARALYRSAPAVVAVHGGDGTLHLTLSALGRAYGTDPMPPIAILCGGTMNVVAASLAIREHPTVFLSQLVNAVRGGETFTTVRRRCLRIGDRLGFLFGNGLMANFLTEYYGTGTYGPARAAWLLTRTVLSAMVGGPFVRRLFRRFEGTVRVDGQDLGEATFVGLVAGTVREVGLGFKLVHRADEDTERFAMLAIHAPPLSLLSDLWSVHAGRGISTKHAFNAVASTMEVVPRDGAMAYTIDGDLYRHDGEKDGALTIAIGPRIEFVRPSGALIARERSDTMRSPS